MDESQNATIKLETFGWNSTERVTDRYGAFNIENSCVTSAVRALAGHRVRATVTVLETRPSGHLGDWAYGFGPTPAEVGEVIELAVGQLRLEPSEGKYGSIAIKPTTDDRSDFWIDPMTLYHLHNQTVEIKFEAVADDVPDSIYPFWCFKNSKQPKPAWVALVEAKRKEPVNVADDEDDDDETEDA